MASQMPLRSAHPSLADGNTEQPAGFADDYRSAWNPRTISLTWLAVFNTILDELVCLIAPKGGFSCRAPALL
jgi:hypothetical protein